MADPRYWLGNDNRETWQAYLLEGHERGGQHLFGFPVARRGAVRKMRIDDIIINYMKEVGTFFAAWEVVKEYDNVPDHAVAGVIYPECVTVKEIVLVDPRQGVPARDLLEELGTFQRLSDPRREWGICVKTSAREWPRHHGEVIVQRLREIAERERGRAEKAQRIQPSSEGGNIPSDHP